MKRLLFLFCATVFLPLYSVFAEELIFSSDSIPDSLAHAQKKSHFGLIAPERIWNNNIKYIGQSRNFRLALMGNSIYQSYLNGNKANGLGYDLDLFGDFSLKRSSFEFEFFWHFENRANIAGVHPNWLNSTENTVYTFTTDGNFYDHKLYPVELFVQLSYKNHSLLIGKHDAGAYLSGSNYGGCFRYFFNQSFAGNPTIGFPFGPTMGLLYIYNHNNQWNVKIEVADANGIATKIDFSSPFNGENWFGAEFALTPKIKGNQGNYRFTAWQSDEQKHHPVLPFIQRSYGYALSIDQYVYANKINLFSRINRAIGTQITSQFSVGLVFDGILPGYFSQDAFGFGISTNRVFNSDIENIAEVFYRFQFSDDMHLAAAFTPSISKSSAANSYHNLISLRLMFLL